MEIKNKQGGLWGKENLAPQSFAISDLQIALQCHLISASAQFYQETLLAFSFTVISLCWAIRLKMQSSINIETVYVTSRWMEPLQNTLPVEGGKGKERMKSKSWMEIVPALGFK